MKTKVLLVLVLGLGIGFGFAVGLVVLPEKAAAEISDETYFKPYTPDFEDWVNVTLKSYLNDEKFVVRQKGGTWLIKCYFDRSSRESHTEILEARKNEIRELCKWWKKEGYDIEFGRDIEWTVNWF
jgi:hypothetical protein